jgi:hypothetical protein
MARLDELDAVVGDEEVRFLEGMCEGVVEDHFDVRGPRSELRAFSTIASTGSMPIQALEGQGVVFGQLAKQPPVDVPIS